MDYQLKVALPKGRLMADTAAMLDAAGWALDGYREGARSYHLASARFPGLRAKVFHEKDIPVQVAVGNYDLGICGLDWVEELLAKYPGSALVRVTDLGYGEGAVYTVASRFGAATTLKGIQETAGAVRIASEYPNLAEAFALKARLRRFCVFPLWGAAEAYPPESADLALVARQAGEVINHDLLPVSQVLGFCAGIIANRNSWETRDLSPLLDTLYSRVGGPGPAAGIAPASPRSVVAIANPPFSPDMVRLALPDGHQQSPTVDLLKRAGIGIDDYPSAEGNRRPCIGLEGVAAKVVRPQDMPQQVANGNFDLAISGRDWLTDHLYRFPGSPVRELADLRFGRVKIVAVVGQDLPVASVHELRQLAGQRAFRVASEYVNIADKYFRDNHPGMYRVVPTWGATEAFLPDDADLLIENTQTGSTIARHNLRIIDTLFESTACLIGAPEGTVGPDKAQRIRVIVEKLRGAVEDGA